MRVRAENIYSYSPAELVAYVEGCVTALERQQALRLSGFTTSFATLLENLQEAESVLSPTEGRLLDGEQKTLTLIESLRQRIHSLRSERTKI